MLLAPPPLLGLTAAAVWQCAFGELGHGVTHSQRMPVQVSAVGDRVVDVACGGGHTLVIVHPPRD